MRAREFIREDTEAMGTTITIPITINIPAGGGSASISAPAGEEMPEVPIMVPPLQQELELMKQQGGRESLLINQLINQDPEDPNDFTNKEDTNSVGADSDQTENESDIVLDLLKKRRDRLEQQ
jgi:hypothetical protein